MPVMTLGIWMVQKKYKSLIGRTGAEREKLHFNQEKLKI